MHLPSAESTRHETSLESHHSPKSNKTRPDSLIVTRRLTCLPNRTFFHDRLRESLDQAGRGISFAVLYLDLDHFNNVNNTLGHPIGDALLTFVANRLLSMVRKVDTVARLGGDEFAIIQAGITNAQDVTYLADRLMNDLVGPHQIDGHALMISTSIGIALAPDNGIDANQLLKCADIALYRSKALGRNRFCYFEQGMDVIIQERRDLERELTAAVTLGELELHYQPQVDISRNVIVAFEALLRWRSPRRGLVSPANFIPLAEETGLIVQIGRWVLERACQEATTWPEHIRVAVNVSAVQLLGQNLVETVQSALTASGLPPERLELEITETVMIADDTRVIETLQALKTLGVMIVMDDFGAGYASLNYLQRIPFDRLKIDRSFVNEIERQSSSSMAIIRAIINLCGSLGLAVIGEGVETVGQLNFLRAEGCTVLQGYFINYPCPAVEIAQIVEKYCNIEV